MTKLLQELEKNPQLKKKALEKQQYISKPPIPSQVMRYLTAGQASKLVLSKSLHQAHATSKPELRRLDNNVLNKMKNKELFLQNLGVFRNSLRTIRLEAGVLTPSEIRALIGVLPSLTNLRQVQMTDKFFAEEESSLIALADSLRQLPLLTKLTLKNNAIKGKGATALARAIRRLTQLRKLDLSVNQIENNEIIVLSEALRHLTYLTYLELSENNIGSEGSYALTESLHQLTKLRKLGLGYNNVRNHGAILLTLSLPRLTQLRVLDLRHNKIGDEGVLNLANNLRNLSHLQKVELQKNNIRHDAIITAVTSSLSHVPHLSI